MGYFNNQETITRNVSDHRGVIYAEKNPNEKEGKKVVWIFLDSAAHMALGTNVSNTLEYAIRASLGFTNFYLERDCKVGFCIYNHDASQWEGPFTSKETVEVGDLGLDQVEA